MRLSNETTEQERSCEILLAVLMAEDGRLIHPIPLTKNVNLYLMAHVTFCVIGFALCYRNRLTKNERCSAVGPRKARQVLSSGLVYCNLAAFLVNIAELFYAMLDGDDLFCRMYVAVVDLPIVLFSVNLFLALAERYAFLAHYDWHRRNVNCCRARLAQVSISTLTALVYKFPYVSRLIPLECELRTFQTGISASVQLTLYVVCTASQMAVYLEIVKLVQSSAEEKRMFDRLLVGVSTHSLAVLPFVVLNANAFIGLLMGNCEGGDYFSFFWVYFSDLPLVYAVYHMLMLLYRDGELIVWMDGTSVSTETGSSLIHRRPTLVNDAGTSIIIAPAVRFYRSNTQVLVAEVAL